MYGVISGFQKLGERIKNRYFDGEPDPAISQQKKHHKRFKSGSASKQGL
jgi:hypothetical protein